MNPDPRERLPREIFEELMGGGGRGLPQRSGEAVEPGDGTGAIPSFWERNHTRGRAGGEITPTASRTRPWPRGWDALKLKIPQVRHLSFYPKSLERGCRSEKALKLAIAEMYVKGVSTRKVSQITEQLCGTEISASQVSRIAQLLDEELEQFRERELGEYRVVYLDAHYEKVRGQWHGAGPGHPESDWSELLGETRSPGGLGGA